MILVLEIGAYLVLTVLSTDVCVGVVLNTCTSFYIELSAEAKAALLEFEERERQHKQGR